MQQLLWQAQAPKPPPTPLLSPPHALTPRALHALLKVQCIAAAQSLHPIHKSSYINVYGPAALCRRLEPQLHGLQADKAYMHFAVRCCADRALCMHI